MTIKELYDWAVKNNVENLELSVQYEDGGGFYWGNTFKEGIEVTASIHEDEGYVLIY